MTQYMPPFYREPEIVSLTPSKRKPPEQWNNGKLEQRVLGKFLLCAVDREVQMFALLWMMKDQPHLQDLLTSRSMRDVLVERGITDFEKDPGRTGHYKRRIVIGSGLVYVDHEKRVVQTRNYRSLVGSPPRDMIEKALLEGGWEPQVVAETIPLLPDQIGANRDDLSLTRAWYNMYRPKFRFVI